MTQYTHNTLKRALVGLELTQAESSGFDRAAADYLWMMIRTAVRVGKPLSSARVHFDDLMITAGQVRMMEAALSRAPR